MKAALLYWALVAAPPTVTTATTANIVQVAPEDPESGVPVTFERPLPNNVQLTPSGDIVTNPGDVPLMQRWWFWAIVVGAAAGVVIGGVAITSSDRYTPQGELGASRTKDWMPL